MSLSKIKSCPVNLRLRVSLATRVTTDSMTTLPGVAAYREARALPRSTSGHHILKLAIYAGTPINRPARAPVHRGLHAQLA